MHHSALHWVSFFRQLIFFSFSVVIYRDLEQWLGHPGPSMALLAIGSCALGVALLRFWIEEYVVTNRRVISRRGIVRRDLFSYPLGRIEAVDVQQSLLGRLLGYGTIEVHTAAEKDGVASRRFVNAPERWREVVLGAIDAYDQGVMDESRASVQIETEDPVVRLRRLEALREEHLISEEEYRERRQEILRGL